MLGTGPPRCDLSAVMPNIVVIMKAWEYNFDPVSKSNWIKQIEADLKQKPFASLQSEWWQGEPLFPLIHQEDLQHGAVRLPDHFFQQPPAIVEYINASGSSTAGTNYKILEALKQDAQSIILRLNPSKSTAYKELLKDVIREIVSLSIEPDQFNKEDIIAFAKSGQKDLQFRLHRNENPASLKTVLTTLNELNHSTDQLRLVYYFPSTGNWVKQTAHLFRYILSDLEIWNSLGGSNRSFFSQVILAVQADHGYFKHILQTRIFHLLWQNIKTLHGSDADDKDDNYLECHIEQSKNEQPDHFLIRASMSALAASLSGTHSLCIHHSGEQNTPSFYKRVNRNIHHLLHLESNMAKGVDPLSGAYPIDAHCIHITKKIWGMMYAEK